MFLVKFVHFALRGFALSGILAACAAGAWAVGDFSSEAENQAVREAIERAEAYWPIVVEGATTRDGAACVRELEPVYAIAFRRVDLAQNFIQHYAPCRFFDSVHKKALISEAELWMWYEPWMKVQYSASDANGDAKTRMRSINAELHYFRLGLDLRLADEVESRFHAMLRKRIARTKATTSDAFADEELLAVARSLFGAWTIQPQVLRIQKLLEQGLGAEHRASLMLLRSAAYHERYLGRAQQALSFVTRAAELSKLHHPKDELLQAHMATEWAACLAAAGHQADAIPKLLQARTFFEAQVPVQWTNIVRTYYNLAGTALDNGDYPAAVGYAERSIDYIKRSGDLTLLNYERMVPATILEVAKMSLGDVTAPARLKAALQITSNPEAHIGSQAFALVRDSVRRGDADMLQWASELTDLHIRRFRAPLQAESALRPLMQAWREGGAALRVPTVRDPLERSLAIALGGGNPSTAALVHFNMARHLSRISPETAIWLYKRAANTLQQLRQGLPTDDQDLYRSWLSNYEDELRLFVSLLIEEGRLPEAEQVLGLLREEELFEYSRRSSKRRNGDNVALSFSKEELARNNALKPLILAAETAAQIADAKVDAAMPHELRTDYKDEAAEQSIQSVQSSLHTLLDAKSAVAVKPVGSAAATDLPAVSVPPRSARLTYVVGKESLDVIVRLHHGSFRQRVLVNASDLNRDIGHARAALSNGQVDPSVPLHRLWDVLIAPLLPKLRHAQVQNLILVPDGALRYLPFASLFDGNRYLVERFTLRTQIMGGRPESNTATLPIRRPYVLAVGRTVGDAQHSALPGVARELTAIRMPQRRVLLDSDFTSSSLMDGLQRKPGIVHVASHFVLDPSGEDKSYLLLGDGGRMSLAELRALPWDGVRLALLSSCDSAISVGHGDGREWVGFAQSLGNAGVKDILATLWRIDDAATARWMTDFYDQVRFSRNQINSKTLASVQRAWLSRHQGGSLAHPHFWAAFVWLST
jgi:CHAT domain-containing protein